MVALVANRKYGLTILCRETQRGRLAKVGKVSGPMGQPITAYRVA